jgi:large subunit ribosomal protein L33
MAKKANTIFIKLVSTAVNPATGKKTGYFYVTRKNPKSLNTGNEKLVFNKYDPVVRKHVEFKEEKLKS